MACRAACARGTAAGGSAPPHESQGRRRQLGRGCIVGGNSCLCGPATGRAARHAGLLQGGCHHPGSPIHRWSSAAGAPTGDRPGRHRDPAVSRVFRSAARVFRFQPDPFSTARHTGAGMASQVTAGRFVGRTQELARLRQLLARAADGESLLALVGGEAGVGKTRLTEQLAATATQQGVRVLRGGCVPLGEEGLPFAPVIEALRGLADQLDPAELQAVAGPARAELARLLPDLAWGGETPVNAPAAVAGQGRLFELLLGLVQRLATSAPLLWVMEDLHWADRSTRDLVAYLATTLR